MSSVLGRRNLHTPRNPTRELNLIVFSGSTRALVRTDRCNETALLRDGKHYTNLEFLTVFTNMILFLSYSWTHCVTVVDCVFCIIIFCTDSIHHILQLYMIWYIKLGRIYLANIICLSLTYGHFYRAITVQKHELQFTRVCIADQSQSKGFAHRIDFNFDGMVRTQGTFGIYNVFQTQWKFL
jgi:hypothetical protein